MADHQSMQEILEHLKQQNAGLTALLEAREREVLILTQQIEWLKRQLFGRSGDRFEHPELFALEGAKKPEASPENTSGPEAEAKTNPQKTNPQQAQPAQGKARPIRGQKLPENLPKFQGREFTPPEVLENPDDYVRVGSREVERLEREPGYFYLACDVYGSYKRKDAPHLPPIQAPAAPALVPGSFWGPSLMAEVLVNKFAYALPFERQHRMNLQRFGVELPVSTMCDVQKNCAEQFDILVRMMKRDALADGYLRMDETHHLYLDRTLEGGSSNGYYWVVRRENGDVIFIWKTGRDGKDIEDWLVDGDFEGVLQADGYAVYPRMVRRLVAKGRKVRLAACLAHIRRKFVDAQEQNPLVVGWIIKHIARLYAIEAELRENRAPPEMKARIRMLQSAPILRLLKRAILHLRQKCPKILPKSMLGKALEYALGQWEGMQVYLCHGQVAIDNNDTERDIRPTAVGKKNHLFIGHPEAGERSAVMYTLLVSARNHGADPYAYLRDLIARLPLCKANDKEALRALLPGPWAEANKKLREQKQAPPAPNVA